MASDAADTWISFVAELATMPDVTTRLLAAHTDDGKGRCRACTTPGRGTPAVRWPCAPAALAIMAHRHHRGLR